MIKLRNERFVKFADDLTTPLVRAEIDWIVYNKLDRKH